MTPPLFTGLAGLLLGLGIIGLWHATKPLGRAGTIGLLSGAAGVLALSPPIGSRIDTWIVDVTDQAGGGELVARLLLTLAVAAWAVHLLELLGRDLRTIRATAAIAIIAAGAMIWQWYTNIASGGTDQVPFVWPETRWYALAFLAGLGIPMLIVLIDALRARSRRGHRRWITVLIVAAVAGLAWCAWQITDIFAADLLAPLPDALKWLLGLIAVAGSWWASTTARSPEPVDLLAIHRDDLGEEELPEDDDPETAAVVVPEPAPAPEPEPVDPVEARRRAVSTALALSAHSADAAQDIGAHSADVPRGTAVAVAASGKELIFATPDGLGYLPESGAGAAGLIPLISRVPESFVRTWIGCAHPHMPLLAAAEEGYVGRIDALAIVGPGGNITDTEREEIEPAELSAPRNQTDSVAVSQIHSALAELRDTWDIELEANIGELAEKVAQSRWTGFPNPDYQPSWVAELAARATEDLNAGEVGSAQYALASAFRVPAPHSAKQQEAAPTPAVSAPVAAPTAPAPTLQAAPRYTPEAAPPATPTTPSAPASPRAMSILAALYDQIPGTADIAVAINKDGTAVFSTSDGLGFLPKDAKAAPNVLPLAALTPTGPFAASWLGCHLPHRTLQSAISLGIITDPEELVTISQIAPTEGVVVVPQEALDGVLAYDLSTAREELVAVAENQIDQARQVLADRFGELEGNIDLRAARVAAEELRWQGEPDPLYRRAWVRYLRVAAAQAAAAGDSGSERYLLASALWVPAADHAVGEVAASIA